MFVAADQLIELGVRPNVLKRKLNNGEWKTREPFQEEDNETESEILLSSLPKKLQLEWARKKASVSYPQQIAVLLSEGAKYGISEQEAEINSLLLPLTPEERIAWMAEALRLARIIELYNKIRPKRRRNRHTGGWEFVPGVMELRQETACKDQLILARHPHRANLLSPCTLDDLSRAFRKKGLAAFLPKVKKPVKRKDDNRRIAIPKQAIDWMNNNWRHYSGPYHLYNALEKEATKQGWKIPSKSWVYRLWRKIPKILKEYYFEGPQAYEAKSAPFVPRDNTDLMALQVLCGDHSERDVTVLLPDKTLTRSWITIWYDLRTGLIWGWCLCLVPSSHTAGLAYANGVRNFGAQPLSRPADGFYSYVYTDHGRDYKSHHLNGKDIVVHKEAMKIDGGLEMLLTQRRVGILDELAVRHLFSKKRNPKERPVERVFKDISAWEQNTFQEYCGSHPKERPQLWFRLFKEHKSFLKGKRPSSPFMTLEQYREFLAGFINRYNSMVHYRLTLGSLKVVPIEEYQRHYTTKYEIASETLSLLLMKAEKRKILKNGVQCFRKHWSYFHEAMSVYKGKTVEMRFSDDNYNSVMVILPNMQMCEAERVTPSSLLNPNKETLKTVRKARANERQVMRDFDLITQSGFRGETIEDRVAGEIESEVELKIEGTSESPPSKGGRVRQLLLLDHTKPLIKPKKVTGAEVEKSGTVM